MWHVYLETGKDIAHDRVLLRQLREYGVPVVGHDFGLSVYVNALDTKDAQVTAVDRLRCFLGADYYPRGGYGVTVQSDVPAFSLSTQGMY